MHNRKIAAKSASSLFFEEYNDVDIYIEDTADGYRKIFKEILNKAFGSNFKIEQVFPLGNREQVINECKKNQETTGRKRVYIIDGDLYLLNGDTQSNLKGLYVLPRYCVENYLFCENAICETADEEEPEMDVSSIQSRLDFNSWISDNERLLLNLFIVYAICFKHLPQEQTIGYKVSKLCSTNTGTVCPTKIEAKISELKTKLISHFGEERLNTEIEIIKERIRESDKKLLRYISGKDYLLPLLITRLQSFLKFPTNSIAVKVRLAKRSNVDELKEIENYIFK